MAIAVDDVDRRLAGPPDKQFDVILIDVDHSPDQRLGDTSNEFYSTQGLVAARQHLTSEGVLGVWSYAKSSPFAEELRAVFKEVHVEPVSQDNLLIDQRQTDWLFFARG